MLQRVGSMPRQRRSLDVQDILMPGRSLGIAEPYHVTRGELGGQERIPFIASVKAFTLRDKRRGWSGGLISLLVLDEV